MKLKSHKKGLHGADMDKTFGRVVAVNLADADNILAFPIRKSVNGKGRSRYLESIGAIDVSHVDLNSVSDVHRYLELLRELSIITGRTVVVSKQDYHDDMEDIVDE